ncbi:HNH endonuclease [Thermoactinomyces vulgaris]|uniref:HNH endonuclease n=1 Tax=Thermoactinomyces vulgaris TaxID=2026 RepID=UPI0036376213
MKNRYEIRGDITVIFIESKKYGTFECLIDTEDLEKVKGVTWHIKKRVGNRKGWDVRCHSGKSTKNLCQVIMNTPKGMVTDHINGDTLDNRKKNLRVTDYSGNRQNLRGSYKSSKTGVRGVTLAYYKKDGTPMYRGTYQVNGILKHTPCVDSIEKASELVKEARRKFMPYSEMDKEEIS